MTLYDIGCLCWMVAFVCFSYLTIEYWGDYEEHELIRHKIATKNANSMRIAMFKVDSER